MPGGNFNMEDPSVQEKVRRGTHEYVAGDGRHGTYAPRVYHHQEYPKVMDRTPKPQAREFKGKPDADKLYEDAVKDWDAIQMASIVHNKAEEKKWLEENKAVAA